MKPGSRWVYRETDSEGTRQKVVVTVTHKTKLIANGITARVVRDQVTENGELVELTDDWYAQDTGRQHLVPRRSHHRVRARQARLDRRAQFEAGIDGAQAGVIMPARPRPGLRYRQEYYKGHAEDKASIVSRREQAEVPAGHYRRVLMTRETQPARARRPRVQVLRPRRRPGARRQRLRRKRPRGAESRLQPRGSRRRPAGVSAPFADGPLRAPSSRNLDAQEAASPCGLDEVRRLAFRAP